ncbi:MAG: hypothetical protein DRI90_15885 [Deltaproteobacteria bacterium]|nr:MAG: hypothetical protein DRI90_15885 [Deltaproteobacteria bacterium]
MTTMKPPIDRLDGPRDDRGCDFRRRGRVGLGMVAAAEVVGLAMSIGYPLLWEAVLQSGPHPRAVLDTLRMVRGVIIFATTLVAWLGLALVGRVPKVGGVAVAAVAVGVLRWVVFSSKLLLSSLGVSPGGLASPFTIVEMANAVLASAYSVLLVAVAHQAADGLSGKRSRLVEITFGALIAVLLVADLASVALFAHYPPSTHGTLLDQYDVAIDVAIHVTTWLSRIARLLLIALFFQVLFTTGRKPTADPLELGQ